MLDCFVPSPEFIEKYEFDSVGEAVEHIIDHMLYKSQWVFDLYNIDFHDGPVEIEEISETTNLNELPEDEFEEWLEQILDDIDELNKQGEKFAVLELDNFDAHVVMIVFFKLKA